jgi:hypothetical protein
LPASVEGECVSTEDLEDYEADVELQLFREYKDVAPMFRYIVETERRFYLANEVHQHLQGEGGRTWIELELRDAWVWDMYRTNRFVQHVKVTTFKDVNIEQRPVDGPVDVLELELELELDGTAGADGAEAARSDDHPSQRDAQRPAADGGEAS